MRAYLRKVTNQWFGAMPPWTPLHLHQRSLLNFVEARVPEVLKRVEGTALEVLDVGCGAMPYRAFFEREPRVARYDGADVPSAAVPVAIAIDPETQAISTESASYDVVVTFQTLEHVARPMALLPECRRVLRPGGVLFATVPFLFEGHGVPRDYRRWTRDGIAEDLTLAGFRDIETEAVESDLESLLVITEGYISRQLGLLWTKPLFLGLNTAALALGGLKRSHEFHMLPLTIAAAAKNPA